ncbi:tetratricopeptide repeat protein [Oceanibium sediminis]|uniref:tetratricopeptide repeat protein n=1 Tax=Oceanibium sediminis TaxID=2026339 RepID=UPI000DD41F81|nr:tetratricopeptide repeat protein [Oceanibium sediminis]
MSQPDSFLDEVSEEVRRDRMVQFFRRNAIWIALGVLVIVGGAAFLEWQKASQRAAAEARGDAIWGAFQQEDAAARAAALESVELVGADGDALAKLQLAAAHLDADDRDAAVAALTAVAVNGDVSEPLRDVARLKLAGAARDMDSAERLDVLEPMLVEGHAMRGLALELRAMIRLGDGDRAAAIEDLNAIGNDARAPAQLRDRAEQMLVILGAGDTTTTTTDG